MSDTTKQTKSSGARDNKDAEAAVFKQMVEGMPIGVMTCNVETLESALRSRLDVQRLQSNGPSFRSKDGFCFQVF